MDSKNNAHTDPQKMQYKVTECTLIKAMVISLKD